MKNVRVVMLEDGEGLSGVPVTDPQEGMVLLAIVSRHQHDYEDALRNLTRMNYSDMLNEWYKEGKV
jgi:hypothetical protein